MYQGTKYELPCTRYCFYHNNAVRVRIVYVYISHLVLVAINTWYLRTLGYTRQCCTMYSYLSGTWYLVLQLLRIHWVPIRYDIRYCCCVRSCVFMFVSPQQDGRCHSRLAITGSILV